ncbi:MAG TPA: hypothetical protein VF441_07725 [Acidimicrobiia bacterium]
MGSPERDGSRVSARRNWLAGVAATIVAGVVLATASALINHEVNGGSKPTVSTTTEPKSPLQIDAGLSTTYSQKFVMVGRTSAPMPNPASLSRSCFTAHRTLVDAGAYDTVTNVTLTLHGARAAGVVINDMRAHVVHRSPLTSDLSFACASEGELSPYKVGFDLDDDLPVARELRSVDPPAFGAPFFEKKSLHVAAGEDVRVDVAAVGLAASYEWDLDVVAVIGGKPQTIRVDNNGKPFRTAPLTDAVTQRWHRPADAGQPWTDCPGTAGCTP